MKHLVRLILLFTLLVLGVSCSSESNDVPKPPNEPSNPEVELPEWNKANTTTVFLFSNFSNNGISKKNDSEITSFLRLYNFHAAFLHGSNIDLSTNYNGTVKITKDLKLYSIYNFSSIDNNIIKGSSAILKTQFEELNTYSRSNFYVSNVNTKVTENIEFPFSIASINNQQEFDSLEALITRVIISKQVLFVVLPSSFSDNLKAKVNQLDSTYRFETKTTKNNQAIVVISPKSWVLRATNLDRTLSNELDVYKLEIEANVIY